MKFFAVLGLLLPLAASAAVKVPMLTAADSATIQPHSEKHRTCMASKAAELINSSDDVLGLTEEIATQCDPLLDPIAAYLQSRGFSELYVSTYLETVRGQHARRISTSLQRQKSGTQR